LDVAYRALHPDLPVYPGILAVDIEGLSDLEVTMMANTITLTPGTLTLDFDRNRDLMFVHTINARELEEVREGIKEVQRYVRRVMK
jgi:multicomponent Na+:H+ antiporter subunit E